MKVAPQDDNRPPLWVPHKCGLSSFPPPFHNTAPMVKPWDRKWLGGRGRPKARCCQAVHVRRGQSQGGSHAHSIQNEDHGGERGSLFLDPRSIMHPAVIVSNLPKHTICTSIGGIREVSGVTKARVQCSSRSLLWTEHFVPFQNSCVAIQTPKVMVSKWGLWGVSRS